MELVTFIVPGDQIEGGGEIHLNPSQIGSVQANHKNPVGLTTIVYAGQTIRVKGNIEETLKALGCPRSSAKSAEKHGAEPATAGLAETPALDAPASAALRGGPRKGASVLASLD